MFWYFFINSGFYSADDPRILKYKTKEEQKEEEEDMVYTKSHTASSFNYCMKQMKIIAKNGFDKWNNPTIKNKKNVKVADRDK